MTRSTVLRRTLVAVWLALAIGVLATVALARLAPVVGLRTVIVAGGSMSPSIPIGSLLAERAATSAGVVAGDVVTIELPSGVAVTHRVARVVTLDGETYLETRGDANGEPDPALVPASAVSGVVVFSVPVAGFVLAALGLPTGVLFVLSALAALLSAIWLLEVGSDAHGTVADAPEPAPGVADGVSA